MQNPIVVENLEEKKQETKIPDKSHKKLLAFAVFLVIIVVVFMFIFTQNKTITQKQQTQTLVGKKTNISPTPFPFQEMTIPYLRERNYESKLSTPEKISDNTNYESFLTGYNSDGYKVNALLTIPNGEMPLEGYPAIVFVHGYLPPSTYETNGQSYSSYVDYLARNGFVVLKIDLRGHGNSEGEPGGGYYGSDYVVDTLNAYAALSSLEQVNPAKIGLWGHSMAGNILLRSFAIRPEIPAVNIWAGAVFTYSDRLKYGINDNSYRPPTTATETRRRRSELTQKYGEFTEKSEFWRQVAPTNYLKDIKGALQLDHAVDDGTVNIGYSRDLAGILSKTGVEYKLNEYPSGGHNITGINFTNAMQNSVDFFDKYLKN